MGCSTIFVGIKNLSLGKLRLGKNSVHRFSVHSQQFISSRITLLSPTESCCLNSSAIISQFILKKPLKLTKFPFVLIFHPFTDQAQSPCHVYFALWRDCFEVTGTNRIKKLWAFGWRYYWTSKQEDEGRSEFLASKSLLLLCIY